MSPLADSIFAFATQTSGLALLLFVAGSVLIIAEILLPTQGILGFFGALSIVGGVVACFVINPWLGLVIMVALVIAAPFLWTAFVIIWPKTPIGRRMVLTEVAGKMPADCTICIGQTGTTVSELRPIGECDFDGTRVEAISEQGLIAPGARVKVVALSEHRPVVQTMEAT
jgi:membrane-bound ClpP family serine protease